MLNYINIYYCKAFKLSLFIALLSSPLFVSAQLKRPGSIEYLKACNGFNGIKLGSDISELSGADLSFLDNNSQMDTDSCLSYQYTNAGVLKMGEALYMESIGLRVYKNKIVNIYLFFKRSEGYKVLRGFLTDYGLFTSKPDDYVDIYDWKSRAVNLSLNYEIRMDMGAAIFTCNEIQTEILVKRHRAKIDALNNPDDKVINLKSTAAITH
jgi:hypothetical protein